MFYDYKLKKELKRKLNDNNLSSQWFDQKLSDNYPKALNFIKTNLDLILSNLSQNDLLALIKYFYQIKELIPNLDKTIFKLLSFNKLSLNSLITLLLDIKSTEELKVFLSQNNFKILRILNIDFIELCNKLIKINPIFKSFINENKYHYIKAYAKKLLNLNVAENHDSIIEVLICLFDEITEHENLSWNDIITFDANYSNVAIIGNKLVKVGKRVIYNIPYDKRILMPLIRVNLNNKDSNLEGIIEVSEKVEIINDISNEELYLMYKELRQRGIICTDLKPSNIGILTKDNQANWHKKISSDLSALGFFNYENKQETLKAGEWVILDTDYIYQEDDPNIHWLHQSRSFENRYQDELMQNKESGKREVKLNSTKKL